MARRCDLTGLDVLAGNNVSHSKRRTRRRFLPNMQNVALKSDSLGENFRMRLATKTVRSIDKNGGLDLFLSSAKSNNLTELGKKLRRKIKKVGLQNTKAA